MGDPVPQNDLPSSNAVPSSDLPGAEPEKSPYALGPNASRIVRPIAQGAVGAITFIPDLIYDVANLPPESMAGPRLQRPSDAWQNVIDKYTSKPQTLGEEASDFVSSSLIAGGGAKAAEKGLGIVADVGKKALSRITTRAAEQAHTAGYKLPPSYIGGPVGKVVQTVSGGPKVEKEMSKLNEDVTDRLAKTELGVHPEHDLDETTFDALKTEAYQPYEEVRKLGKITTDPDYDQAIKAAGGRFANRGKSFSGSRFESIDKEKQPYLTHEFDAGEALDEIRVLRKLSRDNLTQYNPEANALGYTQREIAQALEDQLDRAAAKTGNQDLIARLRAARVQLSKIAAVEDSIGAGGHVSAHDLMRMSDKGLPLTGNLKTIADTAKNFPKATQLVTKQGESGAFSAVDYLLGGSGLVEGAPAITGLSLARPVSRWALKSDPVQRIMMNRVRRGGSPGTAGDLAGTLARGAAIEGYTDDR